MENFTKKEPILPDVDAEWKRFEQEVIRPSRNSLRRNRPKVAAAIILALSVSLLSFAAGVYLKSHGLSFGKTETEETSARQEIQETEQVEVFDFTSEELQTIVSELGLQYGVEPEFRSEEAKHLRLHLKVDRHQSLPEIVDLLNNFREVHIQLEGNRLIVE